MERPLPEPVAEGRGGGEHRPLVCQQGHGRPPPGRRVPGPGASLLPGQDLHPQHRKPRGQGQEVQEDNGNQVSLSDRNSGMRINDMAFRFLNQCHYTILQL